MGAMSIVSFPWIVQIARKTFGSTSAEINRVDPSAINVNVPSVDCPLEPKPVSLSKYGSRAPRIVAPPPITQGEFSSPAPINMIVCPRPSVISDGFAISS